MPPRDPLIPTTLSVTPESAVFTALGDSVRFSAQVRDQNGQVLSGAAVTWSSADPSVVSVTSAGLARAIADGTTTVTASAGSASGSAGVQVRQELDRVVVSPASIDLDVGDTVRLIAEAQDDNGNPLDAVAFVWTSGNEYVATVDSTGLVRARVRGDATITAHVGTTAGNTDVTVSIPHIPPNIAVDEGTSHSLQFGGVYVSHASLTDRHRTTVIALAYADLDGDGRTDIFYSPLDGSMDPVPAEVYINDGMGGFDRSAGFFGAESPGGVHPRKVLPGDFNGDGKPDLFVLDHGFDQEPFPGAHPYALLSSDEGFSQAGGTGRHYRLSSRRGVRGHRRGRRSGRSCNRQFHAPFLLRERRRGGLHVGHDSRAGHRVRGDIHCRAR